LVLPSASSWVRTGSENIATTVALDFCPALRSQPLTLLVSLTDSTMTPWRCTRPSTVSDPPVLSQHRTTSRVRLHVASHQRTTCDTCLARICNQQRSDYHLRLHEIYDYQDILCPRLHLSQLRVCYTTWIFMVAYTWRSSNISSYISKSIHLHDDIKVWGKLKLEDHRRLFDIFISISWCRHMIYHLMRVVNWGGRHFIYSTLHI
jgi:hypothetical protein